MRIRINVVDVVIFILLIVCIILNNNAHKKELRNKQIEIDNITNSYHSLEADYNSSIDKQEQLRAKIDELYDEIDSLNVMIDELKSDNLNMRLRLGE